MTGPELRQLRLELGWSQREVATQLGIVHHTVARYEAGVRTPPPELAQRWTQLLQQPQPRLGPAEPRNQPATKPARKKPTPKPWADREHFRDTRLELGFGQQRVAAMLGVSSAALSAWEIGRNIPSPHKQREMAALLLKLPRGFPDRHAPRAQFGPKAPDEWHAGLRARRQAAGLSLVDLGRRALISDAAVGRYERGHERANLGTMRRIDRALAAARRSTVVDDDHLERGQPVSVGCMTT
jgi:transcriptional regulator with XRE-family HTH domain